MTTQDPRLLDDLHGEERIALLMPFMEIKVYEDGETIIEEGEKGGSIFLIKEGRVRVLKRGLEVAKLTEGESIGEQGFDRERPRTATVVADGRTEVRELKPEKMRELMAEYPMMYGIIWRNIALILALRLERTTEQLAAIAL